MKILNLWPQPEIYWVTSGSLQGVGLALNKFRTSIQLSDISISIIQDIHPGILDIYIFKYFK